MMRLYIHMMCSIRHAYRKNNEPRHEDKLEHQSAYRLAPLK